jgi:hypothetical protein
LGVGRWLNYMGRVCKGFATRKGHRQIQVKYPATLDPSGTGSIRIGADNLDKLIRSTKGPKIVLGYSQGAQVVGAWLRKYAHRPDAPGWDELSFVLIGNPERGIGRQPWVEKSTPEDTGYSIRDVTRKGDNWSDWQGQTKSRFVALFGSVHNDYWKTDIFDPRGEVQAVVGNTTYVRVP